MKITVVLLETPIEERETVECDYIGIRFAKDRPDQDLFQASLWFKKGKPFSINAYHDGSLRVHVTKDTRYEVIPPKNESLCVITMPTANSEGGAR